MSSRVRLVIYPALIVMTPELLHNWPATLGSEVGKLAMEMITSVREVAFSEPVLKSALEQAFQTGSPNTLLMNQKYKNILDGFNDSLNTNVSLHDKVAGREINAYNFQGKHLSALVDADCQDGVLAVLTKESCKKSWQEGDSLKFVDEPKASSREVRGSLQGSIAFSIEGVGHDHLLITGLN